MSEKASHPSGHSMRLYEGLKRAQQALKAQGELGRIALAWMNYTPTHNPDYRMEGRE